MRLKVLLLALVLAFAFAGIYASEAKAEGASVTPYANVLMWMGYTMTDKTYAEYYGGAGAKGDGDVIMNVTPQGSLGVRGSANGVTGDVSFMTRTPSMDTDQQMQAYLFTMYGTYRFGEIGMLAGLFFTPYDQICFGSIANASTAFGWDMFLGYSLFDATRVQVKFDYKGFYFGIFKNTKNETAGYDVVLPMVAAGYQYGFGTPMSFQVHGLYQTYKTDGTTDTDPFAQPLPDKESISSYAVAGDFSMKMDPVTFTVHAHYGINTGNMGVQGGSAVVDGTSMSDTTTMSGWGSVSFVTGAATLSAGVAYKQIDNDLYDKADASMSYFVSCKYNVQPNFALTPTVQIWDGMKDAAGEKEGKQTAFGVLAEFHI